LPFPSFPFSWLLCSLFFCLSFGPQSPGTHQADDRKWTFKCQVELQAHMAHMVGSGLSSPEREVHHRFTK
jgi:hypothetical protein